MEHHLDQCPECGGQWSDQLDDGRKGYPGLGGNIVNDRVCSWHCLHCGASWERGDRSILQEGTGCE